MNPHAGAVDHLHIAVPGFGDSGQQPIPDPGLAPPHEAVVSGRARSVLLEQRPPRRPCPQYPKYAIQHPTIINAQYSRSWPRSRKPPPTAIDGRWRDPKPAEPLGHGPREKTCALSCSSWLHFLKGWRLRQSWCGSVEDAPHRLNGACLNSRRIAETGRMTYEEVVAGKTMEEVPCDQWPPSVMKALNESILDLSRPPPISL